MSGIILLGLGPGDPRHLTSEAIEVLSHTKEVWLRTNQHPVVKSISSTVKLFSFDDVYERGESFDTVYTTIVEKVIELGRLPQGVVYAVPGDPFVAEATCPEIAHSARALGLPVRIVNGVSFLEPVFSAIGIDPYPRLVLMDALDLGEAHVPAFPPDMPVLIAQIYSKLVAAEVKLTLNNFYSDEHPVQFIHAAGMPEEKVENISLYEIDRSNQIGLQSTLFVPPLGDGTSFESFQEIVASLRAPNGCPWDREQTHQSLRPHLLEETYEALESIDLGDSGKMAEELGDLLLQIVLQAQVANEEGEFTMVDVIKHIYWKIFHRHPHVFGDLKVDGVATVLHNWEAIKDSERQTKGETGNGLLDGVPATLPALAQAQEYQERAARVGFDWKGIEGVLEKFLEEIEEVRRASNHEELSREMGDLFFSLVNLARWKEVDSESALRVANMRFKQRFAYLENSARRKKKKLTELSLDEMEALWQEGKDSET